MSARRVAYGKRQDDRARSALAARGVGNRRATATAAAEAIVSVEDRPVCADHESGTRSRVSSTPAAIDTTTVILPAAGAAARTVDLAFARNERRSSFTSVTCIFGVADTISHDIPMTPRSTAAAGKRTRRVAAVPALRRVVIDTVRLIKRVHQRSSAESAGRTQLALARQVFARTRSAAATIRLDLRFANDQERTAAIAAGRTRMLHCVVIGQRITALANRHRQQIIGRQRLNDIGENHSAASASGGRRDFAVVVTPAARAAAAHDECLLERHRLLRTDGNLSRRVGEDVDTAVADFLHHNRIVIDLEIVVRKGSRDREGRGRHLSRVITRARHDRETRSRRGVVEIIDSVVLRRVKLDAVGCHGHGGRQGVAAVDLAGNGLNDEISLHGRIRDECRIGRDVRTVGQRHRVVETVLRRIVIRLRIIAHRKKFVNKPPGGIVGAEIVELVGSVIGHRCVGVWITVRREMRRKERNRPGDVVVSAGHRRHRLAVHRAIKRTVVVVRANHVVAARRHVTRRLCARVASAVKAQLSGRQQESCRRLRCRIALSRAVEGLHCGYIREVDLHLEPIRLRRRVVRVDPLFSRTLDVLKPRIAPRHDTVRRRNKRNASNHRETTTDLAQCFHCVLQF